MVDVDAGQGGGGPGAPSSRARPGKPPAGARDVGPREIGTWSAPGFDLRRIPGAGWALAAILVGFTIAEPSIIGPRNLVNVSYQMTPLLIISIGMTYVILSEGIDLSPGGVVGFVAVVMGLLLHAGVSWPLALVVGVLVGATAGLASGLVVSIGDVPPFVATLGMLGISAGAALMLTKGATVPGFDREVRAIGEGLKPFVIGVGLLLLFAVILSLTRFGRYVRGIGGSESAMVRAGVNVRLHKTAIYTVAGALYGMAAFLILAHDNVAHPQGQWGIEFQAIAAVIVGGTSFEKGRGGLWGTFAGVAMIAFLRSGLNFVGVPTTWQFPLIGGVLIIAIIANVLLQRSYLGGRGQVEEFA